MKQLIKNGQTTLDALVQFTGSIDGLFDFLRLNAKNDLQFEPTGEMLFPEITKKSVVQQLQSAGVAPATADLQIYPVQTEWQSETHDFMDATGIPNDNTILYLGTDRQITTSVLWQLVDSLVVKLKANGIWKNLQTLYPFVGGTAKSHAVNLVKPGLFDINWNSSVRHSSYGVFFDGISAYGKTNFYTSDFLQPKSISVFYHNRNASATGALTGSQNTSSPYGSVIIAHDPSGVYTCLNSSTYQITPVVNQLGLFVHSRDSETTVSVYKRSGNESFSKTYTDPPVTKLVFDELYIGGTNMNAEPGFFSSVQLTAFGVGAGLKATQVDTLDELITTFQTQLNRNV